MKNLIDLNKTDLIEINGGTFAWDAGWFLGNGIVGNFSNPGGVVDALTDYWLHYNT